jgi:hypothetical protein
MINYNMTKDRLAKIELLKHLIENPELLTVEALKEMLQAELDRSFADSSTYYEDTDSDVSSVCSITEYTKDNEFTELFTGIGSIIENLEFELNLYPCLISTIIPILTCIRDKRLSMVGVSINSYAEYKALLLSHLDKYNELFEKGTRVHECIRYYGMTKLELCIVLYNFDMWSSEIYEDITTPLIDTNDYMINDSGRWIMVINKCEVDKVYGLFKQDIKVNEYDEACHYRTLVSRLSTFAITIVDVETLIRDYISEIGVVYIHPLKSRKKGIAGTFYRCTGIIDGKRKWILDYRLHQLTTCIQRIVDNLTMLFRNLYLSTFKMGYQLVDFGEISIQHTTLSKLIENMIKICNTEYLNSVLVKCVPVYVMTDIDEKESHISKGVKTNIDKDMEDKSNALFKKTYKHIFNVGDVTPSDEYIDKLIRNVCPDLYSV